jgi:hypothetical protein
MGVMREMGRWGEINSKLKNPYSLSPISLVSN